MAKTGAHIVEQNDFRQSEKADAQNLIQSDLKIVNCDTLHNRRMGTVTVKVIRKYDKKENPGKDSFPSFCQFFFQANALAAKEIIRGENLFLVPTLRFDKLRRLLFDRNVSQVHSFLKRPRLEAYGWTSCIDG